MILAIASHAPMSRTEPSDDSPLSGRSVSETKPMMFTGESPPRVTRYIGQALRQ